MNLTSVDHQRILRDVERFAETPPTIAQPNRCIELLRGLGIRPATIAIALRMTPGPVSRWGVGSLDCPSVRQAELNILLRGVCDLLTKQENAHLLSNRAVRLAYYTALGYLSSACIVTVKERRFLSNCAARLPFIPED